MWKRKKALSDRKLTCIADNPDWRVYFGLIEAMYQKHPVHIDIAGTVGIHPYDYKRDVV